MSYVPTFVTELHFNLDLSHRKFDDVIYFNSVLKYKSPENLVELNYIFSCSSLYNRSLFNYSFMNFVKINNELKLCMTITDDGTIIKTLHVPYYKIYIDNSSCLSRIAIMLEKNDKIATLLNQNFTQQFLFQVIPENNNVDNFTYDSIAKINVMPDIVDQISLFIGNRLCVKHFTNHLNYNDDKLKEVVIHSINDPLSKTEIKEIIQTVIKRKTLFEYIRILAIRYMPYPVIEFFVRLYFRFTE